MTNRQVDCGFASLAFDKVKPLRQAFAPGVGFMLDLPGGLAADEAIRLCQRFEELDITWIEEPGDRFDVGTLKKTSERVAIPMAVSDGCALKLNEPHVEQHTNGLERPLWVKLCPPGLALRVRFRAQSSRQLEVYEVLAPDRHIAPVGTVIDRVAAHASAAARRHVRAGTSRVPGA